MTGRRAGARLEPIGGSAQPSLVREAVSVNLIPRSAEPFLFTYCPIDDFTSAQGMGGWNNNLGWDDEIGWKD